MNDFTEQLKFVESSMGDLQALCDFYRQVINDTPDMQTYTLWIWGVHPNREILQRAILRGEMYHVTRNDRIVGAFFMSNGDDPDYAGISWKVAAEPAAIFVIHILASSPDLKGNGIGRFMLDRAADAARGKGGRALRLDTFLSNRPAQRLYSACGFRLCGQKQLSYIADHRDTDFLFFEYAL